MDRVLVLTGIRRFAFENLPDRALAPGEVRLRTLLSGVSAGTELSQYRAALPFISRQWDTARRVFSDGEPSWTYPVRNLGYEEVGEIAETGSTVTGLKPGDRIFGTWGHRTGHVMNEADIGGRILPEGADPRFGVFSHVGTVALNCVYDARIRIGDPESGPNYSGLICDSDSPLEGLMVGLFLLSERQMARLSPHFPLAHGLPRVDDGGW